MRHFDTLVFEASDLSDGEAHELGERLAAQVQDGLYVVVVTSQDYKRVIEEPVK